MAILLLLLMTVNVYALEEFRCTDSYSQQGTCAKSLSYEEIDRYAKNNNGGMIFKDKDTKEYTYIPHLMNTNGLIYYYGE